METVNKSFSYFAYLYQDNSDQNSLNQTGDFEDEIDLNRFDQESLQAFNVISPRLREACKRQGFEPQELLKKSISDIREKYKGERLNKEGILLVAQHYEERRIAKLKIVLKVVNDFAMI